MRYKEAFSLHTRPTKSGKRIWYYQTYDEHNQRTNARSTGQTSKAAARNYCIKLIRTDQLIAKKDITFAEYAKDFWIPGKCSFLKAKEARGDTLSPKYIQNNRAQTEREILPQFGKKKLNAISTGMIEHWLLALPEKLGCTTITANKYLATLRIILSEAERTGIISISPLSNNKIRQLKEKPKIRGVVTQKEFRQLFNPDTIDQVWRCRLNGIANLLSALTGMRMGEIQALHVKDVYDDYVHVYRSYDETGVGLKETKTGDIRNIVIPGYLSELLKELKLRNPNGFLFSNDGGITPISRKVLARYLYWALSAIGIHETVRRKRNISFHSWRHFLNSTMRANNITDSKVQKLTGHKTNAMTERYTHFDVGDFEDVRGVQEGLL